MRLFKIFLIIVAVISSGMTATAKGNRQDNRESGIVILFENDVHCAIDGYARMAGLREVISDTAQCLLVGCGDFLQGGAPGSISQGRYVIDIMKAMNYSALTLGNHEFDFGTPRMLELFQYLDAPVTCVNLRSTQTHRPLFSTFIINKVGNRNIAFIGVLTPTAIETEKLGFFDENGNQTLELAPNEVYELVERAALSARRAGADYVIVLSHLGEDDNAMHVNSHGLIASTRGIDAVFDGHTHSAVPGMYVKNRDGIDVLICQTGTKFANVGKCVIDQQGNITSELIPMSKIPYFSPRVLQVTDSIKGLYQNEINRIICHSDFPISIDDEKGNRLVRNGDTNAGNLVADAFRYSAGAQISITNAGGVRTSLPAGDITYGGILSILPFNNSLCTVNVTGETIIRLLDACTQFLPAEHGDFPVISGIRFHVDMKKTPRISQVEVLNDGTGKYTPIVPDQTYTLATTDYCVSGGGLQGILKGIVPFKTGIMSDNQSLIDYVQNKLGGQIGQQYARPQQRIIINR